MEPGKAYSIDVVDQILNIIGKSDPEAAVLTSKETFTLTCGTARQRADIRRKLKEDFVVLPILVDRDELLLNNRFAKSNLFRVEDNAHIHMAAGTIKKHLYYQYSPSTLLLQL